MKLPTPVGQILLDDWVADVKDEPLPVARKEVRFPKPIKTKKQRVRQPLAISDNPSVTLHKGGSRIVVSPDDVVSAFVLHEFRNRMRPLPKDKENMGEVAILEDCSTRTIRESLSPWTLVGFCSDLSKHPLVRALKSFGLQVNFSKTLQDWIAKEEKRLRRELAPYLLPEVKDSRSLFDRAEAGMVFECTKSFVENNKAVFQVGSRYQIVDTAHNGEDGQVKICTTPVQPGAKILMDKDSIFPWTVFHGPMEDYFHFEDAVIYDPAECVPAKCPELVAHYRRKLDNLGLELYEHVREDVVQEACKRSVLNAKLMRMGKTSEAIALLLLWGTKKAAIIGPRNARLFTRNELERLGYKNYVIVDSLEDLKKPGQFYLLTYSWIKKFSDPERINRRAGKSSLTWKYREKKVEHLNEHKCPHCGRTLERLEIKTFKSNETNLVLDCIRTWTKDRGYICRNEKCEWVVENRKKHGAAWSREVDPHTGREKVAKQVAMKGHAIGAGKDNSVGFVGYIDWNLKWHSKCEEKSVKGRICWDCGQADGVWVPPPYKRCKDLFNAVVLDETHAIKAADSDIGRAARSFRARRKMGLTGTPMPNTPADAYWILHYLFNGGSAVFPYHQKEGATKFYDEFCEYITVRRTNLKDTRKMLPYLKNPKKFWAMMAPKMVRRNHEDPLFVASLVKANRFMPEVRMHRVDSMLEFKQAALMVASIDTFGEDFEKYVAETQKNGHLLNSALIIGQMSRMKIAATVPDHFNEKLAKEGKPPIYTGPAGGGKMADIMNLVMTTTGKGGKVLILSDFTVMQKVCAKELDAYGVIRFDTGWDDNERDEAFQQFSEDPEKQIFIGGTRAIREGVDLSAADVIICADLLWEPGLQMQAWHRAMTPRSYPRTVDVYLLTARSTIDQHIYQTFYAKVAATEQALDRKTINRRANQVDIRWFVDQVIADRASIIELLQDRGDELQAYIPQVKSLVMEDRAI